MTANAQNAWSFARLETGSLDINLRHVYLNQHGGYDNGYRNRSFRNRRARAMRACRLLRVTRAESPHLSIGRLTPNYLLARRTSSGNGRRVPMR